MRNIVNRLLQNLRAGVKVWEVPVSPPKTRAEIDLVSRFAAQYYQVFLDIDSKLDKLSSSLLGQVSSLSA